MLSLGHGPSRPSVAQVPAPPAELGHVPLHHLTPRVILQVELLQLLLLVLLVRLLLRAKAESGLRRRPHLSRRSKHLGVVSGEVSNGFDFIVGRNWAIT